MNVKIIINNNTETFQLLILEFEPNEHGAEGSSLEEGQISVGYLTAATTLKHTSQ